MKAMRLTMLTRVPRGASCLRAPLGISRQLRQRGARLRRRGVGALDHEEVGGAHLVIRGIAGECGELERHLSLGEQGGAECHRKQDD
jgi:hypothetical protein